MKQSRTTLHQGTSASLFKRMLKCFDLEKPIYYNMAYECSSILAQGNLAFKVYDDSEEAWDQECIDYHNLEFIFMFSPEVLLKLSELLKGNYGKRALLTIDIYMDENRSIVMTCELKNVGKPKSMSCFIEKLKDEDAPLIVRRVSDHIDYTSFGSFKIDSPEAFCTFVHEAKDVQSNEFIPLTTKVRFYGNRSKFSFVATGKFEDWHYYQDLTSAQADDHSNVNLNFDIETLTDLSNLIKTFMPELDFNLNIKDNMIFISNHQFMFMVQGEANKYMFSKIQKMTKASQLNVDELANKLAPIRFLQRRLELLPDNTQCKIYDRFAMFQIKNQHSVLQGVISRIR